MSNIGFLSPVVRQQAFDLGISSPGALLYTWLSGTSTPQPVYADSGLVTALDNPLEADSSGRFPAFWLANVAYRMTLTDADDATIWGPQDGIYSAPGLVTLWTPTIGGATSQSGQVYNQQVGYATRIGDLVLATWRIALTTLGTITGQVQVKGLPYTVKTITGNTFGFGVVGYQNLTTAAIQMSAIPLSGTQTAAIYIMTAAATSSFGTPAVQADLSNTTIFRGQLIYMAEAA